MGKLLGPRGNSLKRLQEETLTKMSILGKGSMRDKAKVILIIDNGDLVGHVLLRLSCLSVTCCVNVNAKHLGAK